MENSIKVWAILVLSLTLIIEVGIIYKRGEPKTLRVEPLTLATRCPEDYTNEEDRIEGSTSFLTNYRLSNPQSTPLDRIHARINFYIKNHCYKTLENIKNNGGIDKYIAIFILGTLTSNYKCPEEYANLEDFDNKALEDARLFLEAIKGSTIDDFENFYKKSYRDQECAKLNRSPETYSSKNWINLSPNTENFIEGIATGPHLGFGSVIRIPDVINSLNDSKIFC